MKRISLSELKVELENRDYDNDQISEFIEFVKPFYEFNDYMVEKTGKSFDEIDKMMEKYIEDNSIKYLPELLKMKDDESPLEAYTNRIAILSSEFAKDNEYTEHEKVGESMKRYLEFLLVKIFNKK